ncbi:MAG: hypothetical protein RLN76_12540 [Phycisphaeraceae bacterium]
MNQLAAIMDPSSAQHSARVSASSANDQGTSFLDKLERAGKLTDFDAIEAQVTEAAEKLIADLFIQPLMAQARSGPFKSDLFSGGMAEDVFAPHLDAELSSGMSKSAQWPLTQSLVDQLMAAYRQPDKQAATKGVDQHG